MLRARLAVLTLVALPMLASGLAGPASADAAPRASGRPSGLDQAAPQVSARAATGTRIGSAKRVALRQIGDPYRYGAAGPNRFDCSGLVYFSTHQAGFKRVPRTSSQQARFMRHISRARMRAGDFVFFTGSNGVYHVGVYLGRQSGRRIIVHAPSPGKRVQRDPIWTNRWFPGTLRRR